KEEGGGAVSQPSAPQSKEKGELGVALADDPRGGVVVREVDVSGAAAGLLEPGDILVDVDGVPVKTAHEAAERVRRKRDRPVLLPVKRDGHYRFVALERPTK